MRARSILAVTALTTITLAGVGAPVSAAAPARVIGFYRDGPITVDGSTLASMPLPAGSWVILASGLALHDSIAPQGIACTLQAGWDVDMVSTSNGRTARTLALAVVHHQDTGFDVTLTCGVRPGASADLAAIRILAYRMDRLTNRTLPIGAGSTWGSGTPQAIAGWANGPLAIPVGARGTLAELALPKGRWWVAAKFEAQPNGGHASALDCRVELGSRATGYTGGVVRDQVGAGEVTVMQLQHARRLTAPGNARVRCGASRTAYAGWLKVIAIRAGRLVIEGASSGADGPTVRTVARSGPVTIPAGAGDRTMASLALPTGGWVLVATGTAANVSGTGTGYLACRLGRQMGSTRVVDVDLSTAAPHRRTAVMILAVSRAPTARTVTLRCRAGATPLRVSGIRLTAISTPAMVLYTPVEPLDVP